MSNLDVDTRKLAHQRIINILNAVEKPFAEVVAYLESEAEPGACLSIAHQTVDAMERLRTEAQKVIDERTTSVIRIQPNGH